MNKLMQQYLILRAWIQDKHEDEAGACLLYTSPSPRD